MRLLFVVHNPVFGGGQGQIVRLREPLRERGWDVTAVAPPGSDAADRLRAGGVEVEEVDLHRLRATVDPRVQLSFAAAGRGEVRALQRLISERGIDLVQVHGDTNPHGAVAARRAGVAVVWQLYDTRTPPLLRRFTMPVVTRLADAVTTWGRQLGHAYPGVPSLGERWVPVFPPVNDADFHADEETRAAARRELEVPPGTTVLGLVGMRNPSKGHEHFVRALASVRREHPGVVGRILGPPSPVHRAYEERFRAEARALGLSAPGVLDVRDAGDRVPALLPGLDILVLASVPRSEGMPTVILEAMATGLPVVATDVGAVRELVVDGATGYVVAPLDEAALAERIGRLVADPALRARLGAAGRERFAGHFDIRRLADTHVHAYRLALAHRRSNVSASG